MKPSGDERICGPGPDETGLAEYRQPVELQKQLIELVRKNGQSKQACEALRQPIEREAAALRSSRNYHSSLKRLGQPFLRQITRTAMFLKQTFPTECTVSTRRRSFES